MVFWCWAISGAERKVVSGWAGVGTLMAKVGSGEKAINIVIARSQTLFFIFGDAAIQPVALDCFAQKKSGLAMTDFIFFIVLSLLFPRRRESRLALLEILCKYGRRSILRFKKSFNCPSISTQPVNYLYKILIASISI